MPRSLPLPRMRQQPWPSQGIGTYRGSRAARANLPLRVRLAPVAQFAGGSSVQALPDRERIDLDDRKQLGSLGLLKTCSTQFANHYLSGARFGMLGQVTSRDRKSVV